ncbi:alpha/beta hydrolase [Candidatus Nomurabacteria bacterium]|nr:alpha/beta hydrolase [Candidatus Nomurabacteria bacterium]
MRTQVLIIHGGTTFDNKKQYLEYLESQTIDINRIKPGYDWKVTLQDNLGKNYEVLSPKMPNNTYAQYNEWKLWFENLLTVVNKDLILIGHSLGGIFLAKYLSEHLIDNNILSLLLIAAPFKSNPNETLGSFELKKQLYNITKQTKNISLVHSQDDPVVPYNDALLYEKELPGAKLISFKDKQHFNQQLFPELSDIIKKMPK